MHRVFYFLTLIFLLLKSTNTFAQSALSATYNQLSPKENPWALQLDLTYLKRLREESNDLGSGNLNLLYNFQNHRTLYLSTGFLQSLVTTNEDLNYRYGVSDTTLGYFMAKILKWRNGISMDADFSLSAPTSTDSQYSSLVGSGTGGVVFHYPLASWVYLVSRHNGSINFYQYETADEAGLQYNYPWAMSHSVGAGFPVWRLVFTSDLSWTRLHEYSGVDVNTQAWRNGIVVPINKSFVISGFWSWRDRTLTNYALFDNGRSTVGLTMSTYY